MHPFEIFFDKDSQKYYMFLPDGSVMIDGVNCECDERGEDLNVELDLDPGNLPEKLYGHVTASIEHFIAGVVTPPVDQETPGVQDNINIKNAKVRFDGKEEDSVEGEDDSGSGDDGQDGGAGDGSSDVNYRRTFVVCSFGKEENDGLQYDVCTSAINFSQRAILNYNPGEGGGGGGGGKYEADEHSVSLAASGDTAKNNRFKIFGFGTDGHRIDATNLEIGEDASEEEFIVRAKDADGEEFVGYRKIRVGSTSGRTPFEYQKIPIRDADGDEVVGFTRKIVFNKFYFDGRFVDELGDYTITGNPPTVWLECSRVSEEVSDPETGEEGSKESWRFAIVENRPKEDEHTVSVRLYDFDESGEVVTDYRTTFLTLGQKSKKGDEWAEPKSSIAYGEGEGVPSVSLKIEDEMSSGTSEDGGVAEEQKPTGKKQLNLDIKLEKPVLTLNKLKDAVEIEGGEKISVSVEGQKIKIAYDEKKKDPDKDVDDDGEKDPCAHDEGGADAGGVAAGYGDDDEHVIGGGSHGGGGGGGGVAAGGDSHTGDDDCNC